MASVQGKINTLLKAFKAKDIIIFINHYQYYSDTVQDIRTKYVIHGGKPQNGIECYGKLQLLKELIALYKKVGVDNEQANT
jgi:hypothetical protein